MRIVIDTNGIKEGIKGGLKLGATVALAGIECGARSLIVAINTPKAKAEHPQEDICTCNNDPCTCNYGKSEGETPREDNNKEEV